MSLKLADARSVVVGYGTDEGAITLGGMNNRSFSILASDVLDSYAGFSFVALIQVIGRGADNNARAIDFNRNIASIKNLVRYSGNFSYQTDVDRSFPTLTVSNVNGVAFTADVTDTAGASLFTSNDIGRVIEIEDVGGFQILSVTNPNTVVIKLTPEAALIAGAVDKPGRIGNSTYLFRDTDKSGGFFCRPTLQRVENPGDKKFRKTFLWTAVFQRPADSDKDAGRREARISVLTIPGTKYRVVTLSGVYTALNTSPGVFIDAEQAYNAGIGAFAANALSKFGGFANYELVGEVINPDDEFATLAFSRVYKEKKNADATASSGLDDPRITNQNLVLTRRASWVFGLPNHLAPVFVQLNWSAQVDSTLVPPNSLAAFYRDTIKKSLLAVVKSDFGGKSVLDTELATINKDASTINVNMNIYVENASDRSLYLFTKSVGYGLALRKDMRDRWTGVDHAYTRFTPGFKIIGTVDVQVIRRGAPKHSGVASLGFAPVAPTSSDPTSKSNSTVFQAPGIPPFGPINGSGNQWLLDGAIVGHTPFYRGRDLEKDSVEELFTDSNYQTSWTWGTEVVDNVVGNATIGGASQSIDTPVGALVGGGFGAALGSSGSRITNPPSGRVLGQDGAFAGGENTPGAPPRKPRRLLIPGGVLGF